jgi:poly(3-hydroxyoctanoate) depolymerase
MQRLRITVLSLLAAAVPALSPAIARASSPCANGFDPFAPFLPNVICHSQPPVAVAFSHDGPRSRNVFWAPGAGRGPRPAVVLFQGTSSLGADPLGLDHNGGVLGPGGTWNHAIDTAEPFGGFFQVKVVQALLDAGFTVIQPAAHYQLGIGYFWDTNVGWQGSEDQQFIPALIAAIESGAFGPVDLAHLYATGISSGGYMTSRMANEFASRPGQLDPARPFRAVAIESASFESCAGAICVIPTPLPATHPPTLFLHGLVDPIVPIVTAQAYDAALRAQSIPERFVVDPLASHQWIAAAPGEVLTWFQSH